MDLKRVLTAFLLLLGGLLYVGGILYQGVLVLGEPGDREFPEFLILAVTAIGGALGTHLGALLGIKVALRRSLEPQPVGRLQGAAVILYLVGLLAAICIWMLLGFDDSAPDLIKNLSKTLLGVVIGAITVVLGTTTSRSHLAAREAR